MTDAISQAMSDPGPHTAESLAARLEGFTPEAIALALEALTAQGVLRRENRSDGAPEYYYVAPERYTQIHLDVIRNPGQPGGPRRTRGG